MNFQDIATPAGVTGAKRTRARGALKAYDTLAGAELIRRAGKARHAPLRGDKAATLLASRRAQEAEDRLGRQLTDYYQAMLREPVPDRIKALVEALDAQQPS